MNALRSSYDRRRYASATLRRRARARRSRGPSRGRLRDAESVCVRSCDAPSARARASSSRPRWAAMIAAGSSSGRAAGRAASTDRTSRLCNGRPSPSSLPAIRDGLGPERLPATAGSSCAAIAARTVLEERTGAGRSADQQSCSPRARSGRRGAAIRAATARSRVPLPSPRRGCRVPIEMRSPCAASARHRSVSSSSSEAARTARSLWAKPELRRPRSSA